MRAMTRLRARLRSEAPLDDLPVTWSHLTVLHRISEQGPVTATELAQAEHVRRQSMAETLAGLRAGGLVTDSKDPDDGRKVLVSATPEGRALVERSAATREAWLSKAISGTLDAEERRVLLRAAEIMDRLADAEG
jgi:DNA-binding MarR family transcriptional regulator